VGVAAGSSFLISNALGIPMVGQPRGMMLDGILRKWFWGSRVGTWVGKQLSRGRTAPLQLINRPTENALSLAALDLYQALPKEMRHTLGDIPEVVHRLESRAAAMRKHVDALGTLLARAEEDAPTQEVTKEQRVRSEVALRRDEAKQELAAAVAALETIRLGLLKLHGGMDVANTITELNERARDAAGDLDRLSSAANLLDAALPAAPTPA
jgi:hypothetical protein